MVSALLLYVFDESRYPIWLQFACQQQITRRKGIRVHKFAELSCSFGESARDPYFSYCSAARMQLTLSPACLRADWCRFQRDIICSCCLAGRDRFDGDSSYESR